MPHVGRPNGELANDSDFLQQYRSDGGVVMWSIGDAWPTVRFDHAIFARFAELKIDCLISTADLAAIAIRSISAAAGLTLTSSSWRRPKVSSGRGPAEIRNDRPPRQGGWLILRTFASTDEHSRVVPSRSIATSVRSGQRSWSCSRHRTATPQRSPSRDVWRTVESA